MSRIVWTFLAPFCLVLAVLAVVTIVRENRTEPAAKAAQSTGTVLMEGTKFSPAATTVARGTRVVFDNNDTAPHTVTADDGSSDSGIIEPGSAYSLVADASFTFHCEIHPSMTAEIRLEG